jgi:class 3 adenylate cyclase/tetratricopeptide (TPR) repeat protein
VDIASWLRNLGLQEYEDAFRRNRIDSDILANLTAEDLKALGVPPVGDRRRLLEAIAAMTSAAAEPPPAEAARIPAPEGVAQRCQLTVMFCDLVGSTALSARLDPEDMREVLRAYQDACSGPVARYGGLTAKFMGDGILAYFGFPHAHEDNAERAVRAGLDLVAAVGRLKSPDHAPLEARVGIATGLVIVGDLIGEGIAQEQSVTGETPNLAARLQSLAEPGQVVVAAATCRLLGNSFVLRSLGRRQIKGFSNPVEASVVEGISTVESRFEASRATHLSRFVGREAEIDRALRAKELAWRGRGQVVLISGEAGIGKSRLAARICEDVATEPHMRLRYQCSPYHASTPLHPFIAQLERAAGMGPEDLPGERLGKLEALLAMAVPPAHDALPLFAALLSIPLGERHALPKTSPAQQRRQTFSAFLDQLEGLARRRPLLLLFEDAHWADATSLDLLDLAAERIGRLPILAIITHRPEFAPPWIGRPNAACISLGRLDPSHAQTLAAQVAGGKPLPREVLGQIVAKTDGIPLFVEELTKTVLEGGLLIDGGDAYRLEGPLAQFAIPATLQDSLMARLDRFAAVKEIAQIGATVGREFSYELLRAIAGRPDEFLRAALGQLEAAELLFRRDDPPDAVYTFKHALVQDAAYESLLKSRRVILHRRIAETLRDRFPHRTDIRPEIVAQHFTLAGLAQPAAEWWDKAGELALASCAYNEAIVHFGRAIDLLGGALDGSAPPLRRLQSQTKYGTALMHARGLSAPETRAAFARANELATHVEDIAARFSAYYGLWAGYWARAEIEPMQKLGEQALRDAQPRPGSFEASVAHRMVALSMWFEGDYLGGLSHAERALAAYDPTRDRHLVSRLGYDLGVLAMLYLAVVRLPTGDLGRGASHLANALRLVNEIGHVPTLAIAHANACLFWSLARRPERVLEHAQVIEPLGQKHDIPVVVAFSKFYLAWSRGHAGEKDMAAAMREGLALAGEMDIRIVMPFYWTLVAEIEARDGRIETALRLIDEQIAAIETTGERWCHSEVLRVRGEILLSRDPQQAESDLAAAIDVARGQGARLFELRAALALARLWAASGRERAAAEILGRAAKGLEGGSELPEWSAATDLLVSLEPGSGPP